MKGEVVIRDQSINLSDLCMSSNIGSGDLTMVYTTKTDQEATMGFELSLDDILVERLISLFRISTHWSLCFVPSKAW